MTFGFVCGIILYVRLREMMINLNQKKKGRKTMDKRKKYILVIDTETANGFMGEDNKLDLSNSLVYDIGYKVVDKKGNTYEENSFVIYDIFFNKEMMQSAYYKQKIPQYLEISVFWQYPRETPLPLLRLNECRFLQNHVQPVIYPKQYFRCVFPF